MRIPEGVSQEKMNDKIRENGMNNKSCNVNNIYQLNGRVPVMKAIPFGLQHILAMFVSI